MTGAPSVHCTRRWQFRIQRSGLDLHADWARRLRVISRQAPAAAATA